MTKGEMSEKYYTIGTPMTDLPRPVTSGNYSRIESALSGREGSGTIKFHDCSHNISINNIKELPGSIHKMVSGGQNSSTQLQICSFGKDDLVHAKDAKFIQGQAFSCPFLACSLKNSQFQSPGRFPSEFLLNHLHSNHKHRRFNGDSLDLTMVVPQVEVLNTSDSNKRATDVVTTTTKTAGNKSATMCPAANNGSSCCLLSPSINTTQQTWPFVEIYSHKRYFYLEAQSFCIDGHPELFLWLWFLGGEMEEVSFVYNLTVIHGTSEYSYRGPVLSMIRTSNEIKSEGRCLVIRERVWDYMTYKLKILKR